MDKEIKNKIMIVFAVAAFLMLFAFEGKANDFNAKEPASVDEAASLSIPESTDLSEGVVEEDSNTKEPASVDEAASLSIPESTDLSEEVVEEDSTPVYYPSTEESGEENDSFDP